MRKRGFYEMVKLVRRLGEKVDFDSIKVKDSSKGKEIERIKQKFAELKAVKDKLFKIQKIQAKETTMKEKQINLEQVEFKRIMDLWKNLNKIGLEELEKEEILSIVNSQKSFTNDLLEYYMISLKKEKEYLKKVKKV